MRFSNLNQTNGFIHIFWADAGQYFLIRKKYQGEYYEKREKNVIKENT